MTTVGFREAYDNAIDVRIADDHTVKVASLAGLALMKIIAWDDRQFERDAQDLGFIMKHCLDAGNQDRVYSEQGDCFDLLNEDFDYDKASRSILERVLSEATDEAGVTALATAMVRTTQITTATWRLLWQG